MISGGHIGDGDGDRNTENRDGRFAHANSSLPSDLARDDGDGHGDGGWRWGWWLEMGMVYCVQ